MAHINRIGEKDTIRAYSYNKFWDAVQKIEKTIKSCKTIAQIENCKQWMDNVWDNNLVKFRCIGTNLQDMVKIKQLLNTAYSTQRQIILNNQNLKDAAENMKQNDALLVYGGDEFEYE